MADNVVTANAPTKSNAIAWALGALALGAVVFVVAFAWKKGEKAGA